MLIGFEGEYVYGICGAIGVSGGTKANRLTWEYMTIERKKSKIERGVGYAWVGFENGEDAEQAGRYE